MLALLAIPVAQPQAQGGVDILLAQARSLEARGRMDLAADNWRKVLLVNPNQTEALAGLARDAKESGQNAEERAYLDRLRKINPHDPEVMGDQALRRCMELAASSDSTAALNLRLQIAGVFAEQGNPEQAVNIYKQATLLHPENPNAWEGLVGAYTNEGDFPEAISAVRSMPQNSYVAAMKNTGFLNSVAVLYSSQGKCVEAESLLNRALVVDRSDGRPPSQNTELQLADVWMRERNYGNAQQAYQEVVASDANSAEAWRGLMVVLHKQRNDRALVAEIPRIPPAIRTQLEAEVSFLDLEASAESAAGRPQDAVPLLEEARSRYTAQRRNPPVALDIELAWSMLAVSPDEPGLSELLQNTKARADLTFKQQKAIEEIWSVWSVRRADLVFAAKPDLAFTILTVAGREYPGNRNIHAALAALYLKRHDKEKALEVFQTWGMRGAQAGDYRMAAGAAFSAHKITLADEFLRRGLRDFPNDPELIHMNARQDILRGDYQQGERELESALAVMHEQNASEFEPRIALSQNSQENDDDLSAGADNAPSTRDAAGQVSGSTFGQTPSSSPSAPPCQPETARGNTAMFRFRPISLRFTLFHGRRIFAAQQAGVRSATPPPPQSEPSQTQPPAQPPAQPEPEPAQSRTNEQQQSKEQQIQDEIDAVNNRNTPLIGVGSEDSGRVGDPGIDRLIVSDNLLDSAATASNLVRFAVEAHGVYASSGTPNGTSNQLYGTVPAGALFGKQYQIGYAGTAQLSTNTFGLAVGATPQGFPIHNITAGIRFKPLNGWFTFMGVRDSVKDSLLSYAGARDPGTGIRWGGVIANTGTIKLNSAPSNNLSYKTIGEYASASYSFLKGTKVPDNWSASGSAGLYWNIVQGLTVGVNGSAMHYNKNLNFYSFGQGGYFSPQQYYLGSIPISWYARHPRFEYQIKFSGGVQYLHQDASPFYPVLPGTVVLTQGTYAANTSTDPNYDADVRLGYRASRHVYFDIFATANNSSNYYEQSAGFSLKFMIDPIPTSTDLKVDSIPDWTGKQPFSIR